MKKILWLLPTALLLSQYGNAAGALLETPVEYASDASVVDSVRTECKLENMLAEDIGHALAEANKGAGTIDAKGDPAGKPVLRTRISFVLGVGGGGWTGPKAITVKVKLLENGQVSREGKLTAWSTGGAFAAFKGTCDILRRCSREIGEQLAEWVDDPSVTLDDPEKPDPVPSASAAK
jgi:hypothetical protein